MIGSLSIVPPETDKKRVVRDGCAALDTNVLLCPYRLPPNLAEEYLQHLAALSGRFFVPYRVAFEFERRRGQLIREQDSTIDEMVANVRKSLSKAASQLHGQHRYFPRKEAETYLNSLAQQLASDVAKRKLAAQPNKLPIKDAVEQDPIAKSLAATLDGQIAAGYMFDESLIAECQRRHETGRPPGTADQTKGSPDCYGDAMIWLEILGLARSLARRHTPLVVVTGDFKPDWWHYEANWRRTPRFELVQELATAGLEEFVMLAPREFLEAAGCTLSQALTDALRAVER